MAARAPTPPPAGAGSPAHRLVWVVTVALAGCAGAAARSATPPAAPLSAPFHAGDREAARAAASSTAITADARNAAGASAAGGAAVGDARGTVGATGTRGVCPTRFDRSSFERSSFERDPLDHAIAIELVVDVSQSMDPPWLAAANRAVAAAVARLGRDDLVGVLAFDAFATDVVAPSAPAVVVAARKASPSALGARLTGVATDLFTAIDAAYQRLLSVHAHRKHIVLITDGQAPNGALRELVTVLVDEDMTLSTVGAGRDSDEPLLRDLAARGCGRFTPVHDAAKMPDAVVRDLDAVATVAAEPVGRATSAASTGTATHAPDAGARPGRAGGPR